jgi:hypothetical protein
VTKTHPNIVFVAAGTTESVVTYLESNEAIVASLSDLISPTPLGGWSTLGIFFVQTND